MARSSKSQQRIFIVDQSLVSVSGHYAEYTLAVAQAVKQHGLQPIILANKNIEAGLSDITTLPTFSFDWTVQQQRMVSAFVGDRSAMPIISQFGADFGHAMRHFQATESDTVFIHTLGFFEVEDVFNWVCSQPQSAIPRIGILLRRDLEEVKEAGQLHEFHKFCSYVRAFSTLGLVNRKVFFYTDTAELTAAYSQAMKVEFDTMPIPFDQAELTRASQGKDMVSRAGEQIKIGYLGDARPEKGYHHLPAVVGKLYRQMKALNFRFIFQSNYNLPGGEPGIAEARGELEKYSTHFVQLIKAAQSKQAYYALLASVDIVLLPYDPARYRCRSSGIFCQAVGAGKIPIIPRHSSMENELMQLGVRHVYSYDDPDDIPQLIVRCLGEFHQARAEYQSLAAAWLARHSPALLVAKLTAVAPARAPLPPLVLHVVDGDYYYYKTGASVIQNNQRLFLKQQGYRIATLFVVNAMLNEEEGAIWTRRMHEFCHEQDVDFAWLSYYFRFNQQESTTLKGRLSRSRFLTVPDSLQQFVNHNSVDIILFNYITNYPLLQKINFSNCPKLICEILDIQSYQYGYARSGAFDDDELQHEANLIGKMDVVISLNADETDKLLELNQVDNLHSIAPYLFTTPLSIADVAGPVDLAELLSSTGSSLEFVDYASAWGTERDWQMRRLWDRFQDDGFDLLFISSDHVPNNVSLKWFIETIYLPHLAPRDYTLVIAGTISTTAYVADINRNHPGIFTAGRIDNLRPLYAAAKIVVLPIIAGAGVNIKTVEAFTFAKPLVATTMALRGIGEEAADFATFDTPESFADEVIGLLESEDRRLRASQNSWRIGKERSNRHRYIAEMRDAFPKAKNDPTLPAAVQLDCPRPATIGNLAHVMTISRFLRALTDFVPIGRDLIDRVAAIFRDVPTCSDQFDAVVVSLFLAKDAPILATKQPIIAPLRESFSADDEVADVLMYLYVTAFRHYSGIDAGIGNLAGCIDLDEVLLVSDGLSPILTDGGMISPLPPAYTDGGTNQTYDLLMFVSAIDGSGEDDDFNAVMLDVASAFIDDVYLPYLAPQGISMLIVGHNASRLLEAHPSKGRADAHGKLRGIAPPENSAPLLAACKVVVTGDSVMLKYHPLAFCLHLTLAMSGKALLGGDTALWFLPPSARLSCHGTSAEYAQSILQYIASREDRAAMALEQLTVLQNTLQGFQSRNTPPSALIENLLTPLLNHLYHVEHRLLRIGYPEWDASIGTMGKVMRCLIHDQPMSAPLIRTLMEIVKEEPGASRFTECHRVLCRDGAAPITRDRRFADMTDIAARAGRYSDYMALISEIIGHAEKQV